MSGHSKWSSIKHKKGAADAKRGKLFSKLARAIIVAAREGGPDPAANLALQNAIERRVPPGCRRTTSAGVLRGSGTGSDAAAYEHLVRGYGPRGGRLRRCSPTTATAPLARSDTFSRHDGNLAESGGRVVFERKGVRWSTRLPRTRTAHLAAADAGAETSPRRLELFEVTCAPRTCRRFMMRSGGDRWHGRRGDDVPRPGRDRDEATARGTEGSTSSRDRQRPGDRANIYTPSRCRSRRRLSFTAPRRNVRHRA
jgi:transcriptional/translational regulatory protein YebC/TACO1